MPRKTNTLAVYVHDSRGRGVIYADPVGVMTKTDHLARKTQLEGSGGWRFSDIVDWLLGRR